MAKKKQHIDDFFKDQLAGKELPLDGTEWSRLADALGHEDKKRRGFFWWWFGAGSILIALLALGYFFYPTDTSKAHNTDHGENDHTEIAENVKDRSNNSDQSISEDMDNRLGETINSDESNVKEDIVPNTEPSKQETYKPSTIVAEEESNLPSAHSGSLDSPVDADVNSSDHNATEINSKPEVVEITVPAIDLNSKKLTSIPWELILLDSLENGRLKTDKQKNGKIILPKKQEIYIGFKAALTGGDMKFSSALLYNDYAAYRQLNETTMEHLQLELSALTKLKKVELGGGLMYGKLSQTPYLDQMINDPKTLTIQLYDSIPFVDINSDTTWLPFNYRDSVLTTTPEGKPLSVPTYHTIAIPLNVGYEFKLNEVFSLSTTATIQPTFILAANGSINSKRLNYQELNKQQLNSYYTAAAVNFSFQTRITPERWFARLGYTANFTLGDLLKEDDITQKINTQGIHVSLHYRIK